VEFDQATTAKKPLKTLLLIRRGRAAYFRFDAPIIEMNGSGGNPPHK
jgi:hypothetical protein